jgi:hypothetical protein
VSQKDRKTERHKDKSVTKEPKDKMTQGQKGKNVMTEEYVKRRAENQND